MSWTLICTEVAAERRLSEGAAKPTGWTKSDLN